MLLLVIKKGQPIEAIVHLHCVENFQDLLQRYVGEGGVAVNFEKTQFFLNTLYVDIAVMVAGDISYVFRYLILKTINTYILYLLFWKGNFPMSVRASVGWLVSWSVWHNFLTGRVGNFTWSIFLKTFSPTLFWIN